MPKQFIRVCLLTVLCLCAPIFIHPDKLRAQPPLPGDLIFSTGQLNARGVPASHNVLARLDPRTGQVVSFYTDPTAIYLKAMSWSPQGDVLAFLRFQWDGRSYSAQLCLLKRSGVLQGCFEDRPVNALGVYDENMITWSADGTRLYFVSGDDISRRLLEAEVKTGKTLRTLYKYDLQENETDNPPILAWTSDLRYLTIGAGDHTRVQQGLPVLLIDLTANQKIDLSHIPGTQGKNLFVVCPFFSPQATYLTANNYDVPEAPITPQFLLLDNRGALISDIKAAAPADALPQGCPAWQKDEKALYFSASQGTEQASTLRILKYSLESKQFSTTFSSGAFSQFDAVTVTSNISLSPDEKFLAFDSPFDPGVNLGTQVTLISLAGTLQRYSAPFPFSSDPLWIPAVVEAF